MIDGLFTEGKALKIADDIWVAAASLHRDFPHRIDFSVGEIVERAIAHSGFRPGLQVHASVHCVASKAPNPGRYRMLHETVRGRRRLFRAEDPYHPHREGGKIRPDKAELQTEYQHLVDWYDKVYNAATSGEEDAREELRKQALCLLPGDSLRGPRSKSRNKPKGNGEGD